jgi:NTE family protein
MIKHLALCCGGVHGYCILGALEEMLKNGLLDNLESISGCSAGSLIAIGLALGIEPGEIGDILIELKPSSMKVSNPLMSNIQSLMNITPLKNILKKTLNKYPDINTLLDIQVKYGKNVSIVATNYETGKPVYFTPESHPNTPILDCLILSSSIPVVFEPAIFNGVKYWDGGMTDPLPITMFPKEETLGFWIIHDVKKSSNVVYRLMDIIMNTLYSRIPDGYTIIELAPAPLGFIDFSHDNKLAAYLSGQKIIRTYLDKLKQI